jgi:hypothetical protein
MIREQQTTHVCVATAADGLLVTHRTTTSTNDADGTAAHSDLGALGRVKGDLQCVCDRGQRRTGVLFGGQKRPRTRSKKNYTRHMWFHNMRRCRCRTVHPNCKCCCRAQIGWVQRWSPRRMREGRPGGEKERTCLCGLKRKMSDKVD